MSSRAVEAPRSLGEESPFSEFLGRLRASRQRALLLDFDGTLSPLQQDRARVRMYPGVRSALLSLALEGARCRIAIVSGRAVCDLRQVVGLDRCVELWGSYGLERLTLEGCWVGSPPSREISRFVDGLAESVKDRWPRVLERKPYGAALHLRGRPPQFAEEVRFELNRYWAARARQAGLELIAFDGGLELRPVGGHKGLVVRRMFEELGPRAAIAYLGDDRTDEDAFRELRGRGLTVLVRDRPRPSLAKAWIRPPGELLSFLAAWNAMCSALRRG